jgi:hypothetical protein
LLFGKTIFWLFELPNIQLFLRMVHNLTINFDKSYELQPMTQDLRLSNFNTVLKEGQQVPIYVQIHNKPHVLLSDVYNLGFGPLKGNQIDDRAELPHADYSRAFSTILLSGLTYLTSNPAHSLGIDGSDNRRAYLYYHILQNNYDYLNEYFLISGIKYYVRITRFGKNQYDDPFDFKDIMTDAIPIEKGVEIPRELMYNYFIFTLKN